MATLSGQPHNALKMSVECGVTLLERRGALLESRFYDQREDDPNLIHLINRRVDPKGTTPSQT